MYNKNDKSVILYTPPVYESIQHLTLPTTDGTICIKDSDVSLLFNQQRLQVLGHDTIKDWLENLQNQHPSEMENLRSKCSDNQLMSVIKSRHIQSLSDLLHWSEAIEKDTESVHEYYRNKSSEEKKASAKETSKSVSDDNKV